MIEYYKERRDDEEEFREVYENNITASKKGIAQLKKITYENCKDWGWSDMSHCDCIGWRMIEVEG